MNGLPAYLVNIHFLNDTEMKGPASRDEWKGALELLKAHLGIRRTRLDKYIINLFFDVNYL